MSLQKPLISEKAIYTQSLGKYTFVVDKDANKDQIATEFKQVFGITPLAVNTVTIKGKVKINWKNRRPINKPNVKKAIITVGKDKKIDMLTLKNEK
ncbi:50S ribosomal protein L23 [Candidatus Shapirobacteria bacterium CG_4_10_14_3_um_filter_35_13]|uniref:50S ribosomal protein L23 n=1 Tax=Candidatus Shapirobacteria bacterium CG_4_10_14_3_um_filter_35_13 TaxID=1974873 RepID=A0A2M7LJU3_9BACT|nr:MAG: 50S ribosomal protein L23 [Candidatus Shapirobacteria bacterium CG_4_10_14_3_um_filter_35_13]